MSRFCVFLYIDLITLTIGTMDIRTVKLDLLQRMLAIENIATLKRLREVIEQEADQDELTDTELVELEELRAERLRGEGTSYTWEEVERMARDAVKK
jgi:hypothetical protein